jgi:hypothetical protein
MGPTHGTTGQAYYNIGNTAYHLANDMNANNANNTNDDGSQSQQQIQLAIKSYENCLNIRSKILGIL